MTSSHLGLSCAIGDSNIMAAIAQKNDWAPTPTGQNSSEPKESSSVRQLPTKMPIVMKSWLDAPTLPRYVLGTISVAYIGTQVKQAPALRPMNNRLSISSSNA